MVRDGDRGGQLARVTQREGTRVQVREKVDWFCKYGECPQAYLGLQAWL
jgi:hypothetical protein